MSLDVDAFRLLLAGFLLAISSGQETSTLTPLSLDATGSSTTISLTTLLGNVSNRETTISLPISAEPEFVVSQITSNSDAARSTSLNTQLPTVTSATVESVTLTPSAVIQSTNVNDRTTIQGTTTERHFERREVTTASDTTAQAASDSLLITSTPSTIIAQTTSIPVTTQQGTTTCIIATQLETTTQSIPTQVITASNATGDVVQPTTFSASELTTSGTSISTPSVNVSSTATLSSENPVSQRIPTNHILQTSSISSTASQESDLQEQSSSVSKMTFVSASSTSLPENMTATDPTTYLLSNNSEKSENRTDRPSSSENEKKVYLSMYARNVTLIVVIMIILNVMSLAVAIFIFSRMVKRSRRWDRPPSRCGSKRQYFLSRPPAAAATVACTLVSGRDLANDVECQDGESPQGAVSEVSIDSGWCVPLSEDQKKVNKEQKIEEDTGV